MNRLVWLCGGFLGLSGVVIIFSLLTSGGSIVGVQRLGHKNIEYTVLYKNGDVDVLSRDDATGKVLIQRTSWRTAGSKEDELFLMQTGSGRTQEYIVIAKSGSGEGSGSRHWEVVSEKLCKWPMKE